MHTNSTPGSPDPGSPEPVLGGADGRADAALVDGLADAAEQFHAAVETLLRRTLTATRWGSMAGATGLPARSWLHMEARLPHWLVSQLDNVIHRLPAIPGVAEAYWNGEVTFEQLADFVRLSSRLNGPPLARLDREAASLATVHRTQHLPAAQWVHAVEALVDDLRAPGWANRAEQRRHRAGSRVTVQQDFDGGGTVHADLTHEDFTPVVTALETRAGRPASGVARASQRAEALVGLCLDDLAGTTSAAGSKRPARPTMVVIIDLATATTDRFGLLLKAATGGHAPTLSARLCDTLAADAELLVQIAQGRNPLAELRAEDTPAAVRRHVRFAHRECTMPGCHRPATPELVDIHHLHGRGGSQPHAPIGLAPLCREHHTLFHDHDWQAVKDPADGRITFRHPSGTTIASLPAGARPPPWDRDLLWAPPIPDEPPARLPPDVAEDLDPAVAPP